MDFWKEHEEVAMEGALPSTAPWKTRERLVPIVGDAGPPTMRRDLFQAVPHCSAPERWWVVSECRCPVPDVPASRRQLTGTHAEFIERELGDRTGEVENDVEVPGRAR